MKRNLRLERNEREGTRLTAGAGARDPCRHVADFVAAFGESVPNADQGAEGYFFVDAEIEFCSRAGCLEEFQTISEVGQRHFYIRKVTFFLLSDGEAGAGSGVRAE